MNGSAQDKLGGSARAVSGSFSASELLAVMSARLLKDGRGLVMDVKGALDPLKKPAGIQVWRL